MFQNQKMADMQQNPDNVIVVPELEPRLKHTTIFSRVEELKKGEVLVIHNDHDPKPLYFEMRSRYGDSFEWTYEETGPEIWRVKIVKTADSVEILNATLLEPRVKHQTIFMKFDSLNPGESFVLLNDHDPRPLYFQLQQLRGDVFTWHYLQQGPFEFRILITKKAPQATPLQEQSASYGDTNVIFLPGFEPKEKHPAIFKKFDELKPEEVLTIHNDHDPKPLYYQLLGTRGNIFTWEYLQEGPSLWRIRITKKLSGMTNETLGEIVTKDLRKAEVFKKYGLDFCCGGKKTVAEACEEKGIDPAVVERELGQADQLQSTTSRPLPYNDWSLEFLADYIVNTHHTYVKKTMPDLLAYAEKVARVHGGQHPELYEINRLVKETMKEMEEHTIEEEEVLFPYIKRLSAENGSASTDQFDTVKEPIDLRVQEHELVGANMEKIRELSNNYTLPEDSCASYAFLFKALNEFEEDLHLHIHLENNILFPKAIKREKGESVEA